MSEHRLRIELASPVLSPTIGAAFQADTIFGHVCWAGLRLHGPEWLDRFLAAYRDGSPPLVLSNGFPADAETDTVARPLWAKAPPPPPDKRAARSTHQQDQSLRDRPLVTLNDFDRLRRGELLTTFEALPREYDGRPRSHTTVNRRGGSAEEAGLFVLAESWSPAVTIYATADALGREALEAFAARLRAEGYGKRRSAGYGAVRRVSIEPFAGFSPVPVPNGFVSLSNFLPAADDPTEGRWRLLVKRGKLGDERGAGERPFKRPLTFLEAGSCFRASNPGPWYGAMVRDIAPGFPDVIQYGLAYAVPMRLLDDEA
jgi:CRISPR-associated protein Csm4